MKINTRVHTSLFFFVEHSNLYIRTKHIVKCVPLNITSSSLLSVTVLACLLSILVLSDMWPASTTLRCIHHTRYLVYDENERIDSSFTFESWILHGGQPASSRNVHRLSLSLSLPFHRCFPSLTLAFSLPFPFLFPIPISVLFPSLFVFQATLSRPLIYGHKL